MVQDNENKREQREREMSIENEGREKKVWTPQNEKETARQVGIHLDVINFEVERRYMATPKIKLSTENQPEPKVKKVIRLMEEQGTARITAKKFIELVEEQATERKEE